MAEWWESDEKIHEESSIGIWWKGTKKNAKRACPDWLSTNVGFSTTPYEEGKVVTQTVIALGGSKMAVGTLAGAGYAIEKFTGVVLGAHAWCIGAHIGGGVDSLYQYHHGGHHIGENLSDWYISQERGVENFLVNFYEWWNA